MVVHRCWLDFMSPSGSQEDGELKMSDGTCSNSVRPVSLLEGLHCLLTQCAELFKEFLPTTHRKRGNTASLLKEAGQALRAVSLAFSATQLASTS